MLAQVMTSLANSALTEAEAVHLAFASILCSTRIVCYLSAPLVVAVMGDVIFLKVPTPMFTLALNLLVGIKDLVNKETVDNTLLLE